MARLETVKPEKEDGSNKATSDRFTVVMAAFLSSWGCGLDKRRAHCSAKHSGLVSFNSHLEDLSGRWNISGCRQSLGAQGSFID